MATVPWESPEPCPCHLPEQDPDGHLPRTDPDPDAAAPRHRARRLQEQQAAKQGSSGLVTDQQRRISKLVTFP